MEPPIWNSNTNPSRMPKSAFSSSSPEFKVVKFVGLSNISTLPLPQLRNTNLCHTSGETKNTTTAVKIRYSDDNSSIFHEFQATANLALALEHMRSDFTLVIWIDALCINQIDVDERNRREKYTRNVRRSRSGLDHSKRKPIPDRRISQVRNYKESLIQKQSKWHCEPTREWTHRISGHKSYISDIFTYRGPWVSLHLQKEVVHSYVVPPRMRLGSKASVLHWADDDVFPKAYDHASNAL